MNICPYFVDTGMTQVAMFKTKLVLSFYHPRGYLDIVPLCHPFLQCLSQADLFTKQRGGFSLPDLFVFLLSALFTPRQKGEEACFFLNNLSDPERYSIFSNNNQQMQHECELSYKIFS